MRHDWRQLQVDETMGFFSDFFGGSTRSDLRKGKKASDAALTAGDQAATAAYGNAMARFDPYSQSGINADKMLSDAIGLNGQAAYQGVVDNFMGDPFRKSNEDFAQEQLLRHWNGVGASRGGAAALAAARASQERGSTDWNNWLDRLTSAKGQGLQVAGAQAGIDTALGDQKFALGQQRASNEINYSNAMAASRNIGINNLLGVAGLAVKAMTPTPAGSAFGNAMKTVKSWWS